MFRKKPTIKPLSPLRSSDRRKLADQIIAELGLEASVSALPETATEEEKSAAKTAALTALRNSLLPDHALSARFTTTLGADAHRVSGTVYVGAWNNGDQRILWVREGEGQLVPTAYTLWTNPHLLPLLRTPLLVISKLQGGAELMTPGLAGGPPFPERAKKDSLVAIASWEDPEIPLVVGKCLIDVSTLGDVRGSKGVAVQCITWMGDEIWSWSEKGTGGITFENSKLAGWSEKSLESRSATNGHGPEETIAQGAAGLSLGDTGGVSLDQNDEEDEEENELYEVVDKDWTTKEIDDAFRKAFLYAIHQHINDGSPPHYGLNFPLNQSFVVSNLITPYLPTFSKADSDALQIKKTSWKNARKFLVKALGQDRLILVKEGKDEAMVLDIDFDDQRFKDFVPYRLPRKQKSANSNTAPTSSTNTSSDPSIGQELHVSIFYKPKDKLSDLLDTKKYYKATEIRLAVNSYVEKENLVSTDNRRMITLNPFIANSILDGSHSNDGAFLAKGSIPRDTLAEFVMSHCSPYHTIVRGAVNAYSSNTKPKAGHPNKIHITIETRSGSKTVTKVSGLEPYFINAQALADELRKVCAGSAGAEKSIGSSDKNPVMEVVVQGPQSDAVIKSLEKRGVDKKWIDAQDKTKGKKKR